MSNFLYFNSQDIKVFPAGFRTAATDDVSKITSEENLILQSFGQDNFIIEDPRENDANSFLARIYGYLFAFSCPESMWSRVGDAWSEIESLTPGEYYLCIVTEAFNSPNATPDQYGKFLASITDTDPRALDIKSGDSEIFTGLCLTDAPDDIAGAKKIPIILTSGAGTGTSTQLVFKVDPDCLYTEISKASNINITATGSKGDVDLSATGSIHIQSADRSGQRADSGDITIKAGKSSDGTYPGNLTLESVNNSTFTVGEALEIHSDKNTSIRIGDNSSLIIDTDTDTNNSSINIGHLSDNASNISADSTKEIKIASRDNYINSSNNTSIDASGDISEVAGENICISAGGDIVAHSDEEINVRGTARVSVDTGNSSDIIIGHKIDPMNTLASDYAYNATHSYAADTLIKSDGNYYVSIQASDRYNPAGLSDTEYWISLGSSISSYSNNQEYSKNNVVSNTISSETSYYIYMNDTATTGTALSNTAYWTKLSTATQVDMTDTISLESSTLDIDIDQDANIDANAVKIIASDDILIKTNESNDTAYINISDDDDANATNIAIHADNGNIFLDSPNAFSNIAAKNIVIESNDNTSNNIGIVLTVANNSSLELDTAASINNASIKIGHHNSVTNTTNNISLNGNNISLGGNASVTIATPSLTLGASNANIELNNSSGGINLSSTTGNITLETTATTNAKKIEAKVANGSIELKAGNASANQPGSISLSANGDISLNTNVSIDKDGVISMSNGSAGAIVINVSATPPELSIDTIKINNISTRSATEIHVNNNVNASGQTIKAGSFEGDIIANRAIYLDKSLRPQSDTPPYAGYDKIRNILLDMVYPVGSIYISTQAGSVTSTPIPGTNPVEYYKTLDPNYFLGGTWIRLTDRFLYAAIDGKHEAAGDKKLGDGSEDETAGNNDAIVVEHAHGITFTDGSVDPNTEHTGSVYVVAAKDTALKPSLGYTSGIFSVADVYYESETDTGIKNNVRIDASSVAQRLDIDIINHKHSISGCIDTSGGSGEGKNMPKYQAVYMWERIN